MVNVPWCHTCDEPDGLCKCSWPEKVELQPGWLDRNIQEAKKSLPPTDEQLAAARAAGKIEGLKIAHTVVKIESAWEWSAEDFLAAIQRKIAELEAAPASTR